ncbi:MAG TPA: biopolymer transporter ExbD [Thermodesulfobacteriota bacterium]|nr:biopolymer transporter ExbD [Thermodesulfobacteriota bacterium]
MKFKPVKKSKSAGGAIDLTPIVDVVFNLLIFFAVTLSFAATSGGINVKLPSASSADPVETEEITVNLTEDGKLFYNDTSVDLAGLAEKLKEVKNKESIIIIRADSTVPHGKVVQVMDTVKSEGLSKIAIAVDQAPPPDTTNNK